MILPEKMIALSDSITSSPFTLLSSSRGMIICTWFPLEMFVHGTLYLLNPCVWGFQSTWVVFFFKKEKKTTERKIISIYLLTILFACLFTCSMRVFPSKQARPHHHQYRHRLAPLPITPGMMGWKQCHENHVEEPWGTETGTSCLSTSRS